MPVAASVAGSRVAVDELRVRYLLLEAGGYSIIDRSNHVVDGGCYRVNEELTPATLGRSSAQRPARRTHDARDLRVTRRDELTVQS